MSSTSLNVEPFLSKAVFAWMINKTEYKIIEFEKVTCHGGTRGGVMSGTAT